MGIPKTSWRGIFRQSSIAPLKLVPFLPQDNDCSHSNTDEDGFRSKENIARASVELVKCLALPFPTFLSFALEDPVLGKFMDTFLRFRRRHYEVPDGTLEEPPSLPELGRRVFLVLMRAVGPEHASLSSKDMKANGIPAGEDTSSGQMLVSKSGLLGPSAVLDVCALYGLSNPALVATLLESLGSFDEDTVGVTLAEGLGSAGMAAAGALGEVHAKVASLQDGVGGPSVGAEESSDLLSYVTDVAVSVGSLLQVCSRLKLRGAGKDWGPGGEGPFALRLQGSDGEVSPEGLAAALALAFEGSLPILEGVLLGGKSDTEVKIVRARTRLARQWLLRCLHFLVGPVFLEPLGLQESAPGGESSSVSSETTTALADGLLRFIVSLSAASGHLAPTGYAGSLLGEYNLRFRLADALEQADALRSTSSSTSPEAFALEDVGSIGSERLEYLVGILRGLPVSAEALAARAEAAAAAAAKRMSAALEKDGNEGSRAAGSSAGYRGGSPADPEEVDDMIKAVQAVFGGAQDSGGLGEGFVEACLSVMGWSPQAVIEAVLEDRLPSHVAKLNRKLRRAWRGKKGDLDKAYRVDKELAAAETKRLVAMERKQEEDAYLLSREYDDDYDDQYGDREVDVGGGGSGALGDMETVRRVNQLLQDEEEEDAWWEGNKNTNLSFGVRRSGGWRGGGVNDQSDAAEEGKDNQGGDGGGGDGGGGSAGNVGGSGRGRGRGVPGSRGSFGGGGRGRGRGRGRDGRGGHGRGQGPQDDGDGGNGGGAGKDSDRLQQRRKGANKAVVGNHNRKNAARKKESRGMF